MCVRNMLATLIIISFAAGMAALVFPLPEGDFSPRQYRCARTPDSIRIDGHLDEWPDSFFSGAFVDITGEVSLKPPLETQMAMMWDDDFLYVAARMEEPHLWATLTEHDAVIYHDNDFEVFIDPDGDTHNYYEFQINTLGTTWDLFLLKPYRDKEKVAIDSWEIPGVKHAVNLRGTLNDPSDIDQGWDVELAFPWDVLQECSEIAAPPNNGDVWRINFSRVQWHLSVENGQYRKKVDSGTGNILPEENWTWSPQGLIAMHYPERWGFLEFSTGTSGGVVPWSPTPESEARQRLRKVYYAQKQFFEDQKRYATSLAELGLKPAFPVKLVAFGKRYTVSTDVSGTTWSIHEDGWVGIERAKKK